MLVFYLLLWRQLGILTPHYLYLVTPLKLECRKVYIFSNNLRNWVNSRNTANIVQHIHSSRQYVSKQDLYAINWYNDHTTPHGHTFGGLLPAAPSRATASFFSLSFNFRLLFFSFSFPAEEFAMLSTLTLRIDCKESCILFTYDKLLENDTKSIKNTNSLWSRRR